MRTHKMNNQLISTMRTMMTPYFSVGVKFSLIFIEIPGDRVHEMHSRRYTEVMQTFINI